MRPQIPAVRIRDTATLAGTSSPPPKVSPEIRGPHMGCASQGPLSAMNAWAREGIKRGWLPSNDLIWVICKFHSGVGSQGDTGWSGLISPDQCSFRIGHAWGGFNTGKMSPICRLSRSGAQQKSNGDCCPVIILVPHNLFFSQLSLESSELPFLCQSSVQVSVSE